MTTTPKTQFPIRFAINFSRVSTEIQGGEDKTGLARKDNCFENFLKINPKYTACKDIFSDIGVSAFQTYAKRDVLIGILEQAEQGVFVEGAVLVISDVSRLTREPQKESNKLLNRIFDAALSVCVPEHGGI